MSAPDSTPQSAPDIQREIDQTRERLGQTVEELAAKADVKTRAQAKVAEVKTRARVKAAEASEQVRRNQVVRRDWPLALVAAGVLLMGAALARRRRTMWRPSRYRRRRRCPAAPITLSNWAGPAGRTPSSAR